MNTQQQRAILALMIHAALADGRKSDDERSSIRDAAESLAQGAGKALTGVYQDVLLKRLTVADAVATLTEREHRQLAYEMAVCICDADGLQNSAEKSFLDAVRAQLGLDGDPRAAAASAEAEAIAAAAYGAPVAPTTTAAATSAPVVAAPATQRAGEAELDKSILNHAILNGALELLPQSWASMAIIPLQVRMVYKIGRNYGFDLDQGHIKEFLATLGVGLTSQYVEQVGRKLVGGLLGKAAGRMIGGLGGVATGMAFSFATTYALGHLAKRYYAGGRVMSTELLRRTYQELLSSAKGKQQEYLPAIQQRARTLNAAEVIQLVRH